MKRKTIVEIIAALFIIFFVHSAILSFIRLQSLKNLLGFYTFHKTEIAWAIVSTETIIALLLILPRTRTIGLLMSLLFMLCFGVTLWLTPYYPHDFEGILNNMTGKQRWAMVIVSIVLALIAILLKPLKKVKRLEEAPVVYT